MPRRTLKSLARQGGDGILPEDHPKVLDASTRASQWLADGNAASEAGNKKRAEKCYAKSQYWLDRYNKLTGNA